MMGMKSCDSSVCGESRAACAACCSCVLTGGLLSGAILTVVGVVIVFFSVEAPTSQVVDFYFFHLSLVSLGVMLACVGGVMLLWAVCCVTAAKCLRYLIGEHPDDEDMMQLTIDQRQPIACHHPYPLQYNYMYAVPAQPPLESGAPDMYPRLSESESIYTQHMLSHNQPPVYHQWYNLPTSNMTVKQVD